MTCIQYDIILCRTYAYTGVRYFLPAPSQSCMCDDARLLVGGDFGAHLSLGARGLLSVE